MLFTLETTTVKSLVDSHRGLCQVGNAQRGADFGVCCYETRVGPVLPCAGRRRFRLSAAVSRDEEAGGRVCSEALGFL